MARKKDFLHGVYISYSNQSGMMFSTSSTSQLTFYPNGRFTSGAESSFSPGLMSDLSGLAVGSAQVGGSYRTDGKSILLHFDGAGISRGKITSVYADGHVQEFTLGSKQYFLK